jgi:hypothetical protein
MATLDSSSPMDLAGSHLLIVVVVEKSFDEVGVHLRSVAAADL